MKNFVTKNIIIVILFILFAAPGIAAWYFFIHPDLISQKNTNKGQLLTPAIALQNLKISNKWHLVFWNPQACKEDCVKHLDKLAKIRLALGRKLYEVDLDFIYPENAANLTEEINNLIKEQGFQMNHAQLTEFIQIPQFFLANPDAHLILSYKLDTAPADIFHDLKHLLSNPNAGASR